MPAPLRALVLSLFLAVPTGVAAQWLLEPEVGYIARISTAEVSRGVGTAFPQDWTNSPGLDREVTFRFRGGRTFADRHNLHFTWAPLRLEGEQNINALASLPPLAPTADVALAWHQYRLTYRYDIKEEGRLRLGFGLSGNYRIAEAQTLFSNGTGTTRRDRAFQPLVNVYFSYAIAGPDGPTGPRLRILLDADGMLTSEWRNLDLFAGLRWQLGRYGALRGGYRLLDLEANADELSTRLLLHQATLALIVRLGE